MRDVLRPRFQKALQNTGLRSARHVHGSGKARVASMGRIAASATFALAKRSRLAGEPRLQSVCALLISRRALFKTSRMPTGSFRSHGFPQLFRQCPLGPLPCSSCHWLHLLHVPRHSLCVCRPHLYVHLRQASPFHCCLHRHRVRPGHCHLRPHHRRSACSQRLCRRRHSMIPR